MPVTFYVDESGHSGDMVNSGQRYDFHGQPFFALAAVGLTDESIVADEISQLRHVHRIPVGELKSSSLQAKPRFVADVIRYLCDESVPLFVELVDKRYFICMNMATFQLIPPCMGFPEDESLNFLHNTLADFLYHEAPATVLDAFVAACLSPSEESLLASFTQQLAFALANKDDPRIGDMARGVMRVVTEAVREYREIAGNDSAGYLRFLPPPDRNKHDKRVWMLPNLTSFANIYARLNLFYRRRLAGIHVVHDQQLEVDDILRLGKVTAEKPRNAEDIPPTPHSDFRFEEVASFAFAQSHESIGIQLADVLAGAVMRFFRARHRAERGYDVELASAIRVLVARSDERTGYGINQVVPLRHVMNSVG